MTPLPVTVEVSETWRPAWSTRHRRSRPLPTTKVEQRCRASDVDVRQSGHRGSRRDRPSRRSACRSTSAVPSPAIVSKRDTQEAALTFNGGTVSRSVRRLLRLVGSSGCTTANPRADSRRCPRVLTERRRSDERSDDRVDRCDQGPDNRRNHIVDNGRDRLESRYRRHVG